MAQVPYNPVPQVQPSDTPTPKMNISGATEAAFGGQSAAAMGGLARQLEKSGDEIFQRAVALQQLANEAEAQDAHAKFVEQTSELHAQYQATTGMDAVNGRKPYLDELNAVRENIGSGLSNSAALRQYNNLTRQLFSRASMNAAGHSASQFRQYQAKAANAKIQANEQQAVIFPEDEEGFTQAVEENGNLIRHTRAISGGQPPEAIEQEVKNVTSRTYLARLRGMVRDDPHKAQEFLDKNIAKFSNPADLEKAEALVQNKVYTVGSEALAIKHTADVSDEVEGGRPVRGLKERVEAAVAEAEKQRPGDAAYQRRVVTAVHTLYNAKKREIADDNQMHENNIASAINGAYGKPARTPQDITSISPVLAQSWDALKPQKQQAYLDAMAKLSHNPVRWTPETAEEFRRLKGLAGSSEAKDIDEFINTKPESYIGKFPPDAVDRLLKLRETLYKGGSASGLVRNVNTGMAIIERAGIIPPAVVKDPRRKAEFRGALQEAADLFFEQHKRMPQNDDEWRKLGQTINSTQRDSGYIWNTEYPLYKLPPTADEKKQIKELEETRGGKISDQERARILLRSRLKQLEEQAPKPVPKAVNPMGPR